MAYPHELYCLIHRGNSGDRRFYRELCEDSAATLELGCGDGRILEAIRGHTGRLVGLEVDPAFAGAARRRVPEAEIVVADMQDFELGSERFDRVLLPYSTLYCLPDAEAQTACLRRVADHLHPGGLVAFDGWAADDFHHRSNPAEYPHDEVEHLVDLDDAGTRWRIFERSRWDQARQIVDATYVYESDQRCVEASIVHRYLLSEEVPDLLTRSGLTLERISGGFRRERFRDGSPILVVTGRKPDAS